MKTRDLIVAGIGALALYMLAKRGAAAASDAAESVAAAVMPTDPRNWFYRGTNAVGDVLDDGRDDESFSLGREVRFLFYPEERETLERAETESAGIMAGDRAAQEAIARDFWDWRDNAPGFVNAEGAEA